MRRIREVTVARQKQYLEAFVKCGGMQQAACRSININHSTVVKWKNKDPAFAKALADCADEANDVLEAEMYRRAVDGDRIKQFYQGAPIIDPETGEQYELRKVSDTLAIFLLKGRRPEKYGDSQRVQMNGSLETRVIVELPQRDFIEHENSGGETNQAATGAADKGRIEQR